ncbi:MAG: histidine kinase [Bacteroidota bacterium]
MMNNYYRVISILLAFVFPCVVTAQEFNYVQYDTKDGLAGSTVYDMCQDSDGFMWFATENGLSRFDGTNFKNYTVKDGLPDNEVLKIFPDSKGRLWIGTFNKDVCYYYDGKIYNKGNTAWLRKIKLGSAALIFFEDDLENLVISDLNNIIQIDTKGHILIMTDLTVFRPFKSIKKTPFKNEIDDGFIININDSSFKWRNNNLSYCCKAIVFSDHVVVLKSLKDNKFIALKTFASRINQTIINNNTLFVSTTNGSWYIDTIKNKYISHFLVGRKVSHTIKDYENNIWFSTMGDGVFKLPSQDIRNVEFSGAGKISEKEVFCLEKFNSNLLVGLGFSKVAIVKDTYANKVFNYENLISTSTNNSSRNKLHTAKVLSNGEAILGFDAFLLKYAPDKPLVKNMIAIKSIDQVDDDNIVVGAYNCAYKMSTKDLKIVETIFTGRCTKVKYFNGKYYIGTLEGLYEIGTDKTSKYLGSLHPALSRRIADIKITGDGTIWVATTDAGLIAYKDGKVKRLIQEKDGLTSNICKSLFLDKNYLYIGTNKGINRILFDDPKSRILKYTTADGLPSDIINALYVMDSTLYVASPKGLTYFNLNAIENTPYCKLKLLNVTISGKPNDVKKNYNLSYEQNNIIFDYVAFSYKSGGDINYHYKLTGLDTGWKTTQQTSLIYQTLPSGKYMMEMYAINKFGVRSNTLNVTFFVSTPFWKTWWFILSISLAFIAIVIYIFNLRNKALQKRILERNENEMQFAVLEQQALQAQMNPHFIFNCLNSIQQYILVNDKHKANLYLTGFSSLIRQTLNLSSAKTIKVSDECLFLNRYLEMEQMRFNYMFSFFFTGNKNPEIEDLQIPSMLLQPYIENAIRHGLRHKTDGKGILNISFELVDHTLTCKITDNGIGRSKAAEYKTQQHIEYQSKGMSLTAHRISLLNKINGGTINLEIFDLTNEFGQATGTEVKIQIPY